jgi:Zn-dependent peptidase ImmA (M78 family)/DNA-binding XRE family transcriptional regulator
MKQELATTKTVNPEMLVLARESRGMTQIDLSESIGISQAVISRYENGERGVRDDDLLSIADALEYPESFFYRTNQRYGLGSSGLHHRRRKTLPSRTLDMYIAKANILRLIVSTLLRGVDIEKSQNFPQYDIEEFNGDIERIAELVRASWKLPSGPIRDLVGVIENAGGIVHRTNFGSQKLDALVQWVPPTPPIFLVNSSIEGGRLRFTLAHELGHLVMHDVPREDMETEADIFASAFLMPKSDISSHFGTRINLASLAQLKPHWRVSIAALIRRAHDIGAISDRQYRSLYEEMGRLGYRVAEPVTIPTENPTLLQEMIEAHITELGYSIAELAATLSLTEREFREEYMPRHHGLRLVVSSTRKQAL